MEEVKHQAISPVAQTQESRWSNPHIEELATLMSEQEIA